MILTCKCLNILLEADSDSILPFRKYDTLSDKEKNSEFFKNLTHGIMQPTTICKQQPVLVQMAGVGSWLIYRCLNCLWYTHAASSAKEEVIVNKALLVMSKEELSILKKSDDYSPIFHVLILDPNEMSDENKIITFLNPDLKDLNEKAIVALESKLKEAIREKERDTEEQIRSYAEKQYALLNDYKEKAHKECKTLTKLLTIRKESITELRQDSLFVKDTSVGNNKTTPITVERLSRTRTDFSNNQAEAKRQTSPSSDGELEFARNIPASYDCEGLFPLDGMDSSPPGEEENSEEDSTDTEDSASNDEGIHIPKRKNNATIARSVPINVPMNFDLSYQWPDDEVNSKTKRGRRKRPADIAASIKALANSVHGEMLFGDLPPPRTGSKI